VCNTNTFKNVSLAGGKTLLRKYKNKAKQHLGAGDQAAEKTHVKGSAENGREIFGLG